MGIVLQFPVKEFPKGSEPGPRVKYRESAHFKALIAHHSRKRHAAKLQRMPPWCDEEAIRAIYKELRRVERETGIKHHVDHFYPLQGMRVSGLHVANNLRIIPATENIAKSNDLPDCEETRWPVPAEPIKPRRRRNHRLIAV